MLLAAGHPLEVLDRWSWKQVRLVAECIVLHQLNQLEAVLAPLAEALGHEYKPGAVDSTTRPPGAPRGRRKSKGHQGKAQLDFAEPGAVQRAQQRDAALLMSALRAGIRIE